MSENVKGRTYVALDLETTGLSPDSDAIIEVGAVKFRNGDRLDSFQTLVNPHRVVPLNVQRLCHISQREIETAPSFDEVARELEDFLEDHPLIGHNISFDLEFLARNGIALPEESCDTLEMTKLLLPGVSERNLSAVAGYLNIPNLSAHRALVDAEMSREIFTALLDKLYRMDPVVLDEMARLTGRMDWWVGDLLSQVAHERGGNLLLSEANLERVCFGNGKPSNKAPLVPNEEISPLDIEGLASCFSVDGSLARAFPAYEERPQQVTMMRAVARALNEEGHLIVEAGTGTGKSMAYLLPSAFFAKQNNIPVVISTNTINLQEQLVHKDIPDLLDALDPESPVSDIEVAQLKGRTNYLCLRRWEILRKAEGLPMEAVQLLARVQIWLLSTQTGDRSELNIDAREMSYWYRMCAQSYDCLGKKCPYQQRGICFLQRARKAAESAHLIVVNHALLLSEISAGGQILPPYSRLIIDEAHHLEEVATTQLGVEIREKDIFDYLAQIYQESEGMRAGIVPQLQYLARSGDFDRAADLTGIGSLIIAATEKAHNRVSEFFTEAGALLQSLGEGQGEYDLNVRITAAVRAQPAWSEIEIACENLIGTLGEIDRLLRKVNAVVEDLPGLEALKFELITAINVGHELRGELDSMVFHPEGNTVHWLTLGRRNNMITLHSAPLHVGSILSSHLYLRLDSLILTGATLSLEGNFEYLKGRLGLEEVDELLLDSPFDYEQAALVYLVSDIPEPGSAGYQEALERTLILLCEAAEGRALMLFTSHAALRSAKLAIADILMENDILVLGQGVDGAPRRLVSSLQENNRTVILGAASFWEGVDVVGEALSVLGIVRLPFNVPSDPVFAARSETFSNPFNEFALPQAAFKFKQGFGRLIRAKGDRGMLVVLDSRLSKKGYGRIFLNSLPSCRVEKGLSRNLPHVVQEWLGPKSRKGGYL